MRSPLSTMQGGDKMKWKNHKIDQRSDNPVLGAWVKNNKTPRKEYR